MMKYMIKLENNMPAFAAAAESRGVPAEQALPNPHGGTKPKPKA